MLQGNVFLVTQLMRAQPWPQDLASHKVFLYMKGDPAAPQCGFSQMACRILDAYGELPLSWCSAVVMPPLAMKACSFA